jgi:hypothetical protein
MRRAGVIDGNLLMAATARLAGQGGTGRFEAARTLAALSRKKQASWMLAFAIELSYDDDVDTRASAGSCLAQLAATGDRMAAISAKRLVDLLRENGSLVPILLFRGLEDFSGRLPRDVRSRQQCTDRDHRRSRRARQHIGNRDGLPAPAQAGDHQGSRDHEHHLHQARGREVRVMHWLPVWLPPTPRARKRLSAEAIKPRLTC